MQPVGFCRQPSGSPGKPRLNQHWWKMLAKKKPLKRSRGVWGLGTGVAQPNACKINTSLFIAQPAGFCVACFLLRRCMNGEGGWGGVGGLRIAWSGVGGVNPKPGFWKGKPCKIHPGFSARRRMGSSYVISKICNAGKPGVDFFEGGQDRDAPWTWTWLWKQADLACQGGAERGGGILFLARLCNSLT